MYISWARTQMQAVSFHNSGSLSFLPIAAAVFTYESFEHMDIYFKNKYCSFPIVHPTFNFPHDIACIQEFKIVKSWRQLMCPLKDEWIKKRCYVHTVASYLGMRKMKSCNLQQYAWKVKCQMAEVKHHVISFLCSS